ncbi:MAG: NAD(+) synthase [Myxococcales bacterium]|nr:NAD(+) synthase [Myxococcales bacterium]
MKHLRVAAAVLNTTPLDWDGNAKCILQAIALAKANGVKILCLPEQCITGYGCEDAFHAQAVHETAAKLLCEILLPATTGICVTFGLPVLCRNGLYNCAAVACDGKLQGLTAKRFLAGDGIHYEPRWFKAWPVGQRSVVELGGQSVPIGDLHYTLNGLRFGFEVCEDAWVANRPGAQLSRHGIDVILNPSASHFAFGKQQIRKQFVIEGSRAFGVTYVYANLCGNEAGRAIYDGGAIIASGGALVAEGPRFPFTDGYVLAATCDVDRTRLDRARTVSFEPDQDDNDALQVKIECDIQLYDRSATGIYCSLTRPEPLTVDAETQKLWDFARAVALGLFDYLRKSRSHGYALSLSGGADSAACACLVSAMLELARQDLGDQGLREKLGYISQLQNCTTIAEHMKVLLTTAYQATENSGAVTSNAAAKIAEAVGATHHQWSVQPLLNHYREIAEKALARPLDWAHDDIALQNIQARVRAPGIWFLANVENKLLLTTSNRSEAAVGYATMDGDTCGGLAPLAGIDKHFLRRFLRWLHSPDKPALPGLTPIAALSYINAQQPTAELRPPDKLQTDEDDLMPYDVLDCLEKAAIRDKQLPTEAHQTACERFPQYDAQRMAFWVRRFFTLWCRNQWKRERYAPSFHLDDENLDPRSWCRFPILSSGYANELAELAMSVR